MDASHPFAYGIGKSTIHLKQIEEISEPLIKAGMLGSLSDKSLKAGVVGKKGGKKI
ncbi:hypothetical protein [Pedobacter jamesrossensis]|uniref:hypothetical protein n=1 Tax=Pedobacter jamesrossensis TaxID=1908238 RepID=UPI00361AC2E2